MERNQFELTGRVYSIDIEYKESGAVITSVCLSQKKKNGEYDNFYITFFKETAEDIAEKIKKDDYVNIIGFITVDKYTPQGATKAKYLTKFIGKEFTKACYDSDAKKFVPSDDCSIKKTDEGFEVVDNEEVPY